jgi:hypothetical protein
MRKFCYSLPFLRLKHFPSMPNRGARTSLSGTTSSAIMSPLTLLWRLDSPFMPVLGVPPWDILTVVSSFVLQQMVLPCKPFIADAITAVHVAVNELDCVRGC